MGLFVISSKTNGGSEILQSFNGTVLETLKDPDCIATALKNALQYPKTYASGCKIRESIEYLDFSKQLQNFITFCHE